MSQIIHLMYTIGQSLLGVAASDNKRKLPSFFIAGAAFPIKCGTAFYFATGAGKDLYQVCLTFHSPLEKPGNFHSYMGLPLFWYHVKTITTFCIF